MQNIEMIREEGKLLYLNRDASNEERAKGLQLLNYAALRGDPEAEYLIGTLLLKKVIFLKDGDSIERGLEFICNAANKGLSMARNDLNQYTEDLYRDKIQSKYPEEQPKGPLCGFDGDIIKVDRGGWFAPVDAKLEYIQGENILSLKADISFLFMSDEIGHSDEFCDAIIRGIKDWEGEYEVFGGQKVKVKIHLTIDENNFDSVYIIPVTNDMETLLTLMAEKIGTKNGRENVKTIVEDKRSGATTGLKTWSAYTRKYIYVQSLDGRFDDYEEIQAVAKHEFGHVLGLGDLYKSFSDGLPGVKKGSYSELDCYYISDQFYNLVMCDHHGLISNNDIEMVILAFSQNKVQNYQPDKYKTKISEALGRGN